MFCACLPEGSYESGFKFSWSGFAGRLDELYEHAGAEDRLSLDQARARLQAAVKQATEREESEERARNATFE